MLCRAGNGCFLARVVARKGAPAEKQQKARSDSIITSVYPLRLSLCPSRSLLVLAGAGESWFAIGNNEGRLAESDYCGCVNMGRDLSHRDRISTRARRLGYLHHRNRAFAYRSYHRLSASPLVNAARDGRVISTSIADGVPVAACL
jgi:hypothetical protein